MAGIDALNSKAALAGAVGELGAASNGGAGSPARPKNLPEAARQFEALLIAELLRCAHSDEGGWLGSGDDTTASPAIGMAEESLAQAISSHGGLGLSKYIVQSMSK